MGNLLNHKMIILTSICTIIVHSVEKLVSNNYTHFLTKMQSFRLKNQNLYSSSAVIPANYVRSGSHSYYMNISTFFIPKTVEDFN
jgi:hypothetical protein